ncbi:TPA: HNH endonuclease [Serratia marcescens]
MKKLPLPKYHFLDVYNTCVSDCDSNNLTAMRAISQQLPEFEDLYQQRAASVMLHLTHPSRHGHSQDEVISNITKADFVGLYDNCLSKAGTSGRVIYDAIRSSSTGECPLCGIGYVSTLDHYLPKARYPLYSVHPHNLVPACMDCNKGKGSSVLNSSIDEPFHPYFISMQFINEHWIAARIVETKPVTAHFYLNLPTAWDNDSRQRAINHFDGFNLASRYKVQASQFFTMFIEQVRELKHEQNFNTAQVQANFRNKSLNQPFNSITRALMEAIAQSEWFCSEGYIR